jgi:hypothetical protein
MDWNTMTQKMTPYLNKAKEYWEKVAKFAENQIQTTPLFIKTQAEYESIIVEKRVVIIAYVDTTDVAKEIRLLSTVWLTKAFMDTAKLRFINLTESADFAHGIDIEWPIEMHVRYEWSETFRFTNIADIKKWWQAPSYKKEETEPTSKNEVVDPLAGK